MNSKRISPRQKGHGRVPKKSYRKNYSEENDDNFERKKRNKRKDKE